MSLEIRNSMDKAFLLNDLLLSSFCFLGNSSSKLDKRTDVVSVEMTLFLAFSY